MVLYPCIRTNDPVAGRFMQLFVGSGLGTVVFISVLFANSRRSSVKTFGKPMAVYNCRRFSWRLPGDNVIWSTYDVNFNLDNI